MRVRPAHPARALLAVALGEPTSERMAVALGRAAASADIVELRVDMIQEGELDLRRLLHERPCPVIVTNRAAREGGHWRGDEGARLDVLREAMDLGAEYVDVELDAADALQARGRTQRIVSNHDFSAMPADFAHRWRRIAEAGADVVKLVGMARRAADTLAPLDALAAADRPTIAIAMGESGLFSRIAGLRYPACFLTFCALEDGGGTAPGQIGIAELRGTYLPESIDHGTRIYGLLDDRRDDAQIRRLNESLRATGQNARVVPVVVSDPTDAVESIRALSRTHVAGFLVAPAFVEIVAAALDRLDRSACLHAGVNVIRWADGEIVGAWGGRMGDRLAMLTGLLG
ncbi:MAG: type I 3-dehydroquinate dehydratase [Chloroflexota bacterium]